MTEPTLQDSTKTGTWILRNWEDTLRPRLVKYVPKKVETYHLTLLTLLWTLGVFISLYLAHYNLLWLLVASLFILCQYITDLLDGAIGRLRNTGLVKWGYYMDHYLDYVFFTVLMLSYGFIFPETSFLALVIVVLIQIGFMINIFLLYAATNTFAISFAGFGPTEIRILYILLNLFLISFGTTLPVFALPYFALFMATALVLDIYFTQKMIWKSEKPTITASNSQNLQKPE